MRDRRIAAVFAFALVAGCSGPDRDAGPADAAPAAATQALPDRGDAIVFGALGDASTLIPMLASDSASMNTPATSLTVFSSTTRR